jgi:hypothetical protein
MMGEERQEVIKELQGSTVQHQYPLEDIAKYIPIIAEALRKEDFSKGQRKAALLAICGVKVDDSLLRHLTTF